MKFGRQNDGLEIQLSLFYKRDIHSSSLSPEEWLSGQQNGQWNPVALLIHYRYKGIEAHTAITKAASQGRDQSTFLVLFWTDYLS